MSWIDMLIVEVRNEEGGTDGCEMFTALKGKRMVCLSRVRHLVALSGPIRSGRQNQMCMIFYMPNDQSKRMAVGQSA